MIPVLAGYWINSHLLSKKAEFLASSNPTIVYESAVVGGVIFALVWIILATIKTVVSVIFFDWYSSWKSVFDMDTGYGHYIASKLPFPNADSLSLTVVFALVYPMIANRKIDEKEELLAWIRKSRPMGFLIVDAWEKGYPLMVTTRQYSLYIGWVLEAPTISSKKEIWDITIFPMLEGFVHKTKHELYITVDRLEEFDEDPQSFISMDKKFENAQVSSYSIVLPTSEITSIRNFNETPNHIVTFIQ